MKILICQGILIRLQCVHVNNTALRINLQSIKTVLGDRLAYDHIKYYLISETQVFMTKRLFCQISKTKSSFFIKVSPISFHFLVAHCTCMFQWLSYGLLFINIFNISGVTFEGGDILAHYDTNGDVEVGSSLVGASEYFFMRIASCTLQIEISDRG